MCLFFGFVVAQAFVFVLVVILKLFVLFGHWNAAGPQEVLTRCRPGHRKDQPGVGKLGHGGSGSVAVQNLPDEPEEKGSILRSEMMRLRHNPDGFCNGQFLWPQRAD